MEELHEITEKEREKMPYVTIREQVAKKRNIQEELEKGFEKIAEKNRLGMDQRNFCRPE